MYTQQAWIKIFDTGHTIKKIILTFFYIDLSMSSHLYV